MHFLLSTVASLLRGIQATPSNLVYALILLSSAWGAFTMSHRVEGLGLFIFVPLLALLMVLSIPQLSPELQTTLGVFTAIIAVVLLFVVLPPLDQSYLLQGVSVDEWNKFRAFVVALPCMCIMLRIISKNPSQLNLLLFGIPMVVCAGFSVYALRILLG